MSIQTFRLPAGQVAAVNVVSAAIFYRLSEGGENYAAVEIAAAGSASVGPFAEARAYAIDSELEASVVIGAPDPQVLTAPDINGGSADALASLSLANDVLFLSGEGAPVDYTDGDPAATGEGVAGPGSEYVNRTNGKHYYNGGTKAEPLWKLVTSA